MAKPAELNGYPGPAHVLDAADELNLPQETRERIEEIFAAMQAEAQRLGKLYVEAEQRLEEAFAGKSVSSPADLEGLLKDAERLRGQLRMVHLSAHLETAPLLTRHQAMLYNKLRGYGTETGHHQHGNH
ncbi:hypothetical protein [Roseibium aggregatum]|uniref:Periplasmic heavy metal sensor n=1 Tax=Roseibium aggregatum TaxID=187304 RepID=A0A939E9Q7_9HYPH|nr:hypothetical protein [Roseibium aggregatum]MBN9668766.1 hypothetical protein [Roseibium aggregatum]